jgi:hypothetical protein
LHEWTAAGNPPSGIQAFDEIEKILTTDAHIQGESRERNRRILFKPPLGVIFEARKDTLQAVVLDAWLIPRRNK